MPVDLPEGTAALNMPWSVHRSTSTVGCSQQRHIQSHSAHIYIHEVFQGVSEFVICCHICGMAKLSRPSTSISQSVTYLATGVKYLPSFDACNGNLHGIGTRSECCDRSIGRMVSPRSLTHHLALQQAL